MQTFLPYSDFQQSAAVLDRVRLGKQRVEALQTLRALVIPEYGWQSHPAIRDLTEYQTLWEALSQVHNEDPDGNVYH